jgi:hypothetical protein
MVTVADCLRQHAPTTLTTTRLTAIQLKVLSAITRCRTGELGSVHFECTHCEKQHWVGRSCGNRHCPTCQVEKTQVWLRKQVERLLPVHHFLVTFTVPPELRGVLRAHPPAGYRALFAAASQSLRAVAARSRYLSEGELGFFGVLHTWGRDPMVYHPHVHFVVPGGAISRDGRRWLSTPENFFLPGKALSRVYRGKLLDELVSENLIPQRSDDSRYRHDWVVDVKPVGNGHAVLKYLAPYVYRVAISNQRIESCDEQSVTYRYTPSGTKLTKSRPVAGPAFVSGFLQHVLPQGFQKVRYYGWMSPNHSRRLELVKWLVWLTLGWIYYLQPMAAKSADTATDRRITRCARCGGPLRVVEILLPDQPAFSEHALAYLDSG